MKAKRSPSRIPPLTGDDVAQLAYQTLRDTAKLFPKSTEDIEVLESELEGADLPKPDTAKLLRILRGELPRPEPQLTPMRPEALNAVTEGLALAARKGTTISPELRARMDADRTLAERAADVGRPQKKERSED